MTPTRLLLAGVVAASLCGAWTAAEAHAYASPHAVSLPAAARRDAVDHLRAARGELDHPGRAKRDVAAAETALANGFEARGRTPRPNVSPLRETIAARKAISAVAPHHRERAAIDQAIRAVRAAG